jgi:hypothetical protein
LELTNYAPGSASAPRRLLFPVEQAPAFHAGVCRETQSGARVNATLRVVDAAGHFSTLDRLAGACVPPWSSLLLALGSLAAGGPSTPLGATYGVRLLKHLQVGSDTWGVFVFGDYGSCGILVARETGASPPLTAGGGYFSEFGGRGINSTLLGELFSADGKQALLVFQEVALYGPPGAVEEARLRALLVSTTVSEVEVLRAAPERGEVRQTQDGVRLLGPCSAGRQRRFHFDFARAKLVTEPARACLED